MAFQVLRFLSGELKHEIVRETIGVALDGPIECARLDPVKLSQIVVQHDPEASNQKNSLFRLERYCVSFDLKTPLTGQDAMSVLTLSVVAEIENPNLAFQIAKVEIDGAHSGATPVKQLNCSNRREEVADPCWNDVPPKRSATSSRRLLQS